jgi:hypothetical protein
MVQNNLTAGNLLNSTLVKTLTKGSGATIANSGTTLIFYYPII